MKQTAIVRLTAMSALVALALLALSSGPAEAATTFTVNKTSDAKDRKISDSVCDTSRKRGKQCTLRAAIQESNDTAGADTINFKIGGTAPVKTINIGASGLGPLPEIRDTVTINGYSQPGSSPNTLAASNNAVLKIELNGSNTGPMGDGLRITSGSDSIVKGLIINRSQGDGIEIFGGETLRNAVRGNFIGTNASGNEASGNNLNGVNIDGAIATTIGGTEPAARNVISGNVQNGIQISKSGASIGPGPATNNTVKGNFIGTKANGTQALGNNLRGVHITNGTSNTTVGGMDTGEANVISGNGDDGVAISSGTGNSVLSNLIFRNTGLGIDLGTSGTTANDPDDPDTGANNLQNFPVVGTVIRSSTTGITTVSGTLDSNPNQTYTIQCFLADGPEAGYGEGFQLLASTTTTTDAGGDAPFACTSTAPNLGSAVSTTATNTTTGDTSEFSQNVAVTGGT